MRDFSLSLTPNLRWLKKNLSSPPLVKRLKKQRNAIGMAMIFLGLIIVPSGLLGYFSWRALENEKLLSREHLQESYRQFARLAGREIDEELESVEKHTVAAVKALHHKNMTGPSVKDLDKLVENESLIAAVFLLAAPGKVVYPPGLGFHEEIPSAAPGGNESYLREHEIFNRLIERGEEREYRDDDLNGAIACYGEILSIVRNPQLLAIAESYIGRALQKKGEWAVALTTFQNLLIRHPEMRDLNGMDLRFLAQYQIAVCLENLKRDQEAIAALLRLYRDLLERSDAISTEQYAYFLELIQASAPRLFSSPKLTDHADYRIRFKALAAQNKKRISQKYFLQLLDQMLNEMVIKRKHYKSKFYYVSNETEGEPYLLAYQSLPDPSRIFVTGLLGLQFDLAQLRQQLFPAILRHLKFSEQVTLAILNKKGDYIIGTAGPAAQPIAVQALAAPFDFWQVAVYLNEAKTLSRRMDFRATLGLWLISLLLLSILSGAYLFVRRARREAHLSQMKSTFVSSVSHELRTPLASIKMLAELMEMQRQGRLANSLENYEEKTGQYLSVIRRESDRLGRLIENVLDFSKIERGFKQYNFEYDDPAAVLRMAVESFRPHAEANGFLLTVEIVAGLPEVRMDADAISQVMLNLLSNAVKYSDEVKKIRVQAYRDGAEVIVEVADRGIGIDAAEISKIFQDFYRIDQRLSSQKQGGMGLGLTLVRHIVRAHGGEVSVRSEMGRGSTFIFTLPISPVHVTTPANGEAKNAARIDFYVEAEP